MGAGLALPLVGDLLGMEGAEAEAQWRGGGVGEYGTQEHWKNAIFLGHQQGFKNANGTGPWKYVCHKVEPWWQREPVRVWKVMRILLLGPHPQTSFPPLPTLPAGLLFPGGLGMRDSGPT